jgi:hypothetical protein
MDTEYTLPSTIEKSRIGIASLFEENDNHYNQLTGRRGPWHTSSIFKFNFNSCI